MNTDEQQQPTLPVQRPFNSLLSGHSRYPRLKRAYNLDRISNTSAIQQLQAVGSIPLRVSQSPNLATTPNSTLRGIPGPVSAVRAYKTPSGSQHILTLAFLEPPNDPFYSHTKIWLVNYNGSANPTFVGSSDTSPTVCVVNATGETVQVIAQSCGNKGDALLAASQTTTIAL